MHNEVLDIIHRAERQAEHIKDNYERGLLTSAEYASDMVLTWMEAQQNIHELTH